MSLAGESGEPELSFNEEYTRDARTRAYIHTQLTADPPVTQESPSSLETEQIPVPSGSRITLSLPPPSPFELKIFPHLPGIETPKRESTPFFPQTPRRSPLTPLRRRLPHPPPGPIFETMTTPAVGGDANPVANPPSLRPSRRGSFRVLERERGRSREGSRSPISVIENPYDRGNRDGPKPVQMNEPTIDITRATTDEINHYMENSRQYGRACRFAIEQVTGEGMDLSELLETIPPIIDTTDDLRIQYRQYAQWRDWVSSWKELVDFMKGELKVTRETQAALKQLVPATGAAAPGAVGGGVMRQKFPTPTKFKGKIGTEAQTFLVQCQNYVATIGTTWTGNFTIRWVLQLMEDKVGPWAELQLRRMAQETDAQGNIVAQELTDWPTFQAYYATQWFDHAKQICLRKEWSEGLKQMTSAKDFFAKVEILIAQLGYDANSQMVFNKVFAGLKEHVQMHLISNMPPTLAELKVKALSYDELHFALRKRDKPEKGKGKANAVVAATGGGQGKASGSGQNKRRLTDKENLECKLKNWCFECKRVGKEIVGFAKEHPNHKKESTSSSNQTQKTDSKKKTGFTKKKATVNKTKDAQETDADTVIKGLDEESSPEEAKN